MKRIVGLNTNKAKPPQRSIDDVVQSNDAKANELDSKAGQCDNELKKISQQLKTIKSGASKQSLQERAKSILIRKKRFEQQAETLRESSFNVDSLASSINTAKDTKLIANVLQSSTKQLKKDLRKINLDKLEETQDELADLIEFTEDVQSAIAKNYDVPIDIDDDELNAQLELLGDEIVQDNDTSYIDEALRIPDVATSGNGGDNGNPTAPLLSYSRRETDEFGLPILDNSQFPKENANMNNSDEQNPSYKGTQH